MARKKSSGGEKGGNWMDTYGDMVTLLLTFFVMLYASSSFDKGKWQYILQAFTSRGEVVNEVVDENNEQDSEDPYVTNDELADGELPETFDQLYQYLVNYVDKNALENSVEVSKGVSNIYLKFRDNIFFSGDSEVLLQEGKDILSRMSDGIRAVDDKIMGVKVSGHTAESQYSKVDDYTLASGRSVSVVNYLKSIEAVDVDSGKLVTQGFGQYRPIAPNDTEENMSKNRRVEIIIVRNDVDLTDPAVIDEFMKMEFGTDYVTPDNFLPTQDSQDNGIDSDDQSDDDSEETGGELSKNN